MLTVIQNKGIYRHDKLLEQTYCF